MLTRRTKACSSSGSVV